MEVALIHFKILILNINIKVSILVFMEVALIPLYVLSGFKTSFVSFNPCFYGSGSNTRYFWSMGCQEDHVSILVFMEVALIQYGCPADVQ